MKVLALSSSPRKDGNSRMLAQAVLDGAVSRGHDVEIADLVDVVSAPLRDCRTCRRADGTCSIEDGYETLLRQVLAADAIVLATPLYWYGIAGQLKIFIDRLFCYTKADYPHSAEVKRRIARKRLAVVLTSEESYLGSALGVMAQVQEMARYLHHEFVGVVRGVANSRGEVTRDPANPMGQAFNLGVRLFDEVVTDYQLDSERDGVVWPEFPRATANQA
ncbi:flavodoxin family protein [Saccharopolyspora sp. K220]|uniref:flavodoxin family protein n=1 Tax=Saccharopolyspora soli TaxID=2926618 RepID=UPI001F56055E|nr:flavodoxin family protein [Saccharopolyspora soli]MCI2420912.1 flavodoxin family protein [Saccharopolyspora soli]